MAHIPFDYFSILRSILLRCCGPYCGPCCTAPDAAPEGGAAAPPLPRRSPPRLIATVRIAVRCGYCASFAFVSYCTRLHPVASYCIRLRCCGRCARCASCRRAHSHCVSSPASPPRRPLRPCCVACYPYCVSPYCVVCRALLRCLSHLSEPPAAVCCFACRAGLITSPIAPRVAALSAPRRRARGGAGERRKGDAERGVPGPISADPEQVCARAAAVIMTMTMTMTMTMIMTMIMIMVSILSVDPERVRARARGQATVRVPTGGAKLPSCCEAAPACVCARAPPQ